MSKAEIRDLIDNFVATLHIYDIFAMLWLGLVLLLIAILVIIFRKNVKIVAGLTLLFLILTFFAPPTLYILTHKYLYGTEYTINYIKQMKFANVMVVKGTFRSNGEANISECRFHTFILPPQKDGLKKELEFLYVLRPLRKETFVIHENLSKGETAEFKFKFVNFKSAKDINSSDIYIYRECFNPNLSWKF
jgi:hypothetical protein